MKTLIAFLLLTLATVASAQQTNYVVQVPPLPKGGKYAYADQYSYPGILKMAQQSNTPTTILLNYRVRHQNFGSPPHRMFNQMNYGYGVRRYCGTPYQPSWASQYRATHRLEDQQPIQCSPIMLNLRTPPNPLWISNPPVRPMVGE